MEKHLFMDISNGGLLYQMFYVLAFLAAYTILIIEGYRRKFPLIVWILILASIRLFVVVGTKIFSFSPEEWRYMFETHTLLPNPQKTMFGGVLLGVVAYIIARQFLKFRHSAWDTVAIAFPVAVSIQTIGCFFYGCCFGNPSSIPWAVQYPVMTLPHYHQLQSGLLTFNDLRSLPVHPVQLYQILGGILVVCLVIRFRRYWKAKGSLLLSSVIFFSLTRFIIEFFRDPLSNKSGGEILWILKQVQWQYLILAVLMTLLLIWREKNFKVQPVFRCNDSSGLNRQIGFLISLLLILLMLRNWLTLPEIIAINIALVPAVFLIGIEIIKTFKSLRYWWLYACTFLLPLFLMSQTFPQTQIDTTGTKKYKTYQSIGGGFATGNYTDKKTTYTGTGCDRISNDQYFSHKYTAGGIGYSFTKIDTDRDEVITYGANALFGNYTQLSQLNNPEVNKLLLEVSPYIKYDTRWIGIGGGLHLGSLAYTTGDTKKETNPVTYYEKSYFTTFIFPQIYFRLGLQKYLYADFHVADQFPVSSPGLAFQTGIGTGFGLNNGMNLRFGTSFLDDGALYLSAYIPVKNRIVLEPLFLWTMKDYSNEYPVKHPENQFSLGLSYRFGHK
jgi:phosphatidylglycerol:prolipoprotein diacylglycerol transferase